MAKFEFYFFFQIMKIPSCYYRVYYGFLFYHDLATFIGYFLSLEVKQSKSQENAMLEKRVLSI